LKNLLRRKADKSYTSSIPENRRFFWKKAASWANLSHRIAVSSLGEAYIKELGNNHRKIVKAVKEKKILSRIKVIIPTASTIQLVRRTVRAKIVKL